MLEESSWPLTLLEAFPPKPNNIDIVISKRM
jgi:hypothetical protein